MDSKVMMLETHGLIFKKAGRRNFKQESKARRVMGGKLRRKKSGTRGFHCS